MTYRVAIVGSRGFPGEALVRRYVQRLPQDAIVVSGGARGVDTWAESEAKKVGLQTHVVKADWGRHGRAAGPLRNQVICDSCDWLVAYWDGKSRGTRDTINRCVKGDIPHVVVTYNERRDRYELASTVDLRSIRMDLPEES